MYQDPRSNFLAFYLTQIFEKEKERHDYACKLQDSSNRVLEDVILKCVCMNCLFTFL